jgi:hypothetical protein
MSRKTSASTPLKRAFRAGSVSPLERAIARSLKSVRRSLSLSEKEFASTLRIPVEQLLRCEAGVEPFPESVCDSATLERVSGLCSAAQTRIEEAAACLAELQQEPL